MFDKSESVKASIVIPVFNEQENVRIVVNEVSTILAGTCLSYEIILVDDGSSDLTWQEINKGAKEFPFVKGLRLSRNFGHQNALFAGYQHAQGDCIISMDGDLQHPPTTIPTLIDHWRRGYKIVNTQRLD